MLDDVLRHHAIDNNTISMRRGISGADHVPAAGDLAGGSARRGRPAQHSRHGRRTSELAAAAAAVRSTRSRRRSILQRCRPRRANGRARRTEQTGIVRVGDRRICPCRDRRLWTDRRLRDRGAGRPRRIDRLAVLARLRFRRLFCRAARHAQERPLADRTGAGEVTKSSRRYWDNTLILETRFETADGVVALIDFMPPRGNASDVVRLVRGVSRHG